VPRLAFALALLAAEELRTPGEEVLAELEAALRSGDSARAVALLAEAAEIHAYPASAEEARRLLAAAAQASASRDLATAAAALRALGAMGDEAAVPHVEFFLRELSCPPGEEPLRVEAVRAAGRLAAPALLAPLVNLARRGGNVTLAEQAFLALGEYARAPAALRAQAVERTLDAASALSRAPAKEEARARRLRPAALRALQRLAGVPLSSVEQYEVYWAAAKRRKDPFAPR
jgi:hypothetical protein